MDDGPGTSVAATHVGDPERIPGSWLPPGLTLAAVGVWCHEERSCNNTSASDEIMCCCRRGAFQLPPGTLSFSSSTSAVT